jgi:hypothetical protein
MSFWELLPPMGLCERPTNHCKNQEATGPGQVRRPRRRKCLLKGCEKNFHPQQAAERYCREECRQKAREWSEWKAQLRYRASEKGKEKRKAQSRRYRERVRGRKEQEAVDEAARVISLDFFLMVSATGPGAIRGSSTARDHPGNASVRSRAGVRWSGWWSGNGDGGSRRPANGCPMK